MNKILWIMAVIGVFLITTAMFMYFYRLDINVGNNTKSINCLQQNDSVFLLMSKKFKEYDSIKLKLLEENHKLLIDNNNLLNHLIKSK